MIRASKIKIESVDGPAVTFARNDQQTTGLNLKLDLFNSATFYLRRGSDGSIEVAIIDANGETGTLISFFGDGTFCRHTEIGEGIGFKTNAEGQIKRSKGYV